MGLFGSSKAVIGIDIGVSSLKAVAMEKVGNRPKIIGYGISPLPEGVLVDGNIADNNALTETLKELTKSLGHKGALTNVGLSSQNVISRFIKVPQMKDEELEEAIKFEAEQYVPYALEDVCIGFSKLSEIEEEGMINFFILLVCAQKEIVNNYLRTMKQAGLNANVLDVNNFAALNAMHEQISDNEVVAVIDVGAGSTDINVCRNGILEFHRNISIAGNSITSVIQSVLKLEFAQAENIKKEEGKIITEGEEENEVSEVIRTVVEDLSSEIRRSFDYYKAQQRQKVIHKIFLSGGSAYLRNIDVFLANELGIEVVVSDPLMSVDIGVSDESGLREHALELSAAIGLALREMM
ncbi:MAG: type IV pilus assembly protein PilM [Candidatus Wallbacteria bacterium]|nr:type IV pilus assembly protein PilM [Candidatus Wallbacteria bacterium]